MASAIDVAKYYLHSAQSEDEPDLLSHLRLQKLLYYAQGWSLALRKKPLFKERIEAWAHGPVVPGVYPHFAAYKANAIPAEEFDLDEDALSNDERSLCSLGGTHNKQFSATRLREMTHAEPPWREAYSHCIPGEKCQAEITLMR